MKTNFSHSMVMALLSALMLQACASSRTLDGTFSDIGADARLKQVLLSDRTHNYSDVDITVFEGRLLLTGTMLSDEGRLRLIENAWKADGVKEVIDEVYVGDNTPFGQGIADARIDTAVKAKLVSDQDVKSGDVKIAVSNGVVYLIGAVRDRDRLEKILNHARRTGGVNKVVTHVLYSDLAAL